ncbi:putative non-specific serine/threonine protein kinase [Helianthus annuus]|nr:putative non-specific serine/threonine protein kinase [Helianthus annuus]
MKPMIITSSCSYCIQRILCVQFSILDYLHLSKYCRHLLFHIFVANPSKTNKIDDEAREEYERRDNGD